MAEVFKPAYHVDPASGKRVNSSFPGAVRKKSPTWWIRYYTSDGKRHKVKGYKDKRATDGLAAELERKADRQAAGIVDPTEEHAKRPLAEHAEDYRRYLVAKGSSSAHVRHTMPALLACLDGCRHVRMSDLQPSAVVGFLAELRKPSKAADGQERPGKSIATANHYLTAVKGFTRWLWKDRRIGTDPLAGMSKLANAETDVRRARRELSQDELTWLLNTTRQSARVYRYLSGLDRYALYLTGAGTGLRAAELASLTPDSFHLQGPTPFVRLQAAYAKNRKEAEQPLPPDVADVLHGYLASKPAEAPVWPGTWSDRAGEMIEADLDEARGAWLKSFQNARERAEAEQGDFLSYRDAEGCYADFHGLRHTYISRVVRSGATAKAAQSLARHSTVQLTIGRYAHVSLYDLAGAIDALPSLCSAEPKALSATGTDGMPTGKSGPSLGPYSAISGDFERQTETEAATGPQAKTSGKSGKTSKSPGWESNPQDTRSGDFKSPAFAISPPGVIERRFTGLLFTFRATRAKRKQQPGEPILFFTPAHPRSPGPD